MMPRIPRGEIGGHAHHVLNRGNGGRVIFPTAGDYWAFLDLLAVAKRSFPVKVFAFCLMPNHFHLVIQAEAPQALSTFMHWWMTSHVRSEEHTSELQSRLHLVCRLLLEKKKKNLLYALQCYDQ